MYGDHNSSSIDTHSGHTESDVGTHTGVSTAMRAGMVVSPAVQVRAYSGWQVTGLWLKIDGDNAAAGMLSISRPHVTARASTSLQFGWQTKIFGQPFTETFTNRLSHTCAQAITSHVYVYILGAFG